MPQPFELNSIEKGIHCAALTGGCFNLDANLFKPEAVVRTYFYVRTPHAERLVLTQKKLKWMPMAIHGFLSSLYFDLM